ncbi:ABC transporter permease subunit [Bradyrhizobium yuanmingense]|uniref:ABC transporter permease n=1 Tax=Bradyrhizobium yuanmingense TaxID=108015 RepID=UPI0012FC2FA3|nr:ABC transporter permease [Bradyrhizobium yuanmingense]MVT55896.1 ABC transporter permease subunit [Bradyrhizobium yuanmingense]
MSEVIMTASLASPKKRREFSLRNRALPWIIPSLLAGPLLVYLAVFYTIPVLAMLLRSLNDPGWSLNHYAALFSDAIFLKVFWITLRTAWVVTLGCLILGYPVALSLSRARSSAPIIMIAILLPFWTSVLVRSYAWMVLLGRHGVINEGLLALGILEQPLRVLNTTMATHIAMIHILLPYIILPIANSLRQIDPSLERAASGLGATPWATFSQVTLPLSMPGVVAGVLLVFVMALGFYITPALVGGSSDISLSMLIAQQVELLNWGYAATLSVVLLAATLGLIGVAQLVPGVGNAFRLNK